MSSPKGRQTRRNDASDLLNFHYKAPQPNHSRRTGGGRYHPNARGRGSRNQRRTSEKRSPNHFFLLSSPNHAFILSRIPPKHQNYSFEGPDSNVTWESVRMVKNLTPLEERCPICLDEFLCPRITKCGHSFCLSCLIHHVHVAYAMNPYQVPKCPCCSTPLRLDDLRPVQFVSRIKNPDRITMVKLHRRRDCPSPYLPMISCPRRGAKHAAPCQTDGDAAYCKFNYVCPDLLEQHIQFDLKQLKRAIVGQDGIEQTCLVMAIERVDKELQSALAEQSSEREVQERYTNPSSGIYLAHPQHLLCETDNKRDEGISVKPEESTQQVETTEQPRNAPPPPGDEKSKHKGSMYLNDDEIAFYQAQDGSMVFMSGFNMNCLRFQYNALPDMVQGKVLETESLLLTTELRSKFRFLSHLPVDSEIVFVELALGSMLSSATRKHFAKEFQKRQKSRLKAKQAEKRADQRAQRVEELRIEQLKANAQFIDPGDNFFHHVVEQPVTSGDDFGPQLRANPTTAVSPVEPDRPSFSQIARVTNPLASDSFPALSSDDAFPSLGESPEKKGDVTKKPTSFPRKSKKKGKKVLLFSTSGQRDLA